MTYGVTTEGFVIKPFATIKSEIEQDCWDNIADTLDLTAETPLGQLIGIISDQLSELWELGENLYRAWDPDNNTGDAQDAVGAITGAIRLPATYGTVSTICTGDDTTVITAGSKGSDGSTNLWSLSTEITLSTATSWAAGTGYVAGDIVTNSARIYFCTTAGTSAGAGGPTTTATDITDNTVHWRYIGEGAAYDIGEFQADETGPIAVNAWTMTTIETPISGWENVDNPLDADAGTDIETDAEFRVRRENLLRVTGAAAVGAIRADVLDVDDVTSCTVFENTGDVADGDGVPAHAIEVLVLGGDDDEIAQAIWDSVAGGIERHGDDSGTAVDVLGDNQTVEFTRPTEKTIYIIIDITTNSDYPSDGDDQVKEALVAFGATLSMDDDVIVASLYLPALSVSGVIDVTSIKIGFTSPPTLSANLTISNREISTWDTSYITVNAT